MIPKDDPAIAEIREVRHRISERFGHDPQRIVAYYIELQKKYQHRLLVDSESKTERAMWQPSADRFELASAIREEEATYSVEGTEAPGIPSAMPTVEE
ncbi:MAG: hypothetical protein NT169_01410 [Chloroflexi bacterium]|nr:hypothetical protein [Chloroflexota bacterium]